MKRFSKVLFWLAIAGALVAAIVTYSREQPALVDMASVERKPLRVTVDEDGMTRIRERYIVSTPLSGRLERVQLKVGDPVFADTTVLARMQPTDPSLLDPRAEAQAKARVQAAERRLDAAKNELSQAETRNEFASKELERARNLPTQNTLSLSEYELFERDSRLLNDEVRAARVRVDIAQYELELEKAALLLTSAEDNLSPGDSNAMELSIKSPINGSVLRINRESSAVLSAGEAILELGDRQDLEVVTDVLSSDAVKISPDAHALLVNWGGDKPLHGKVRTIEPSGFTKISALGVEEQRVNVIIDIVEQPDERESLGDGFRVDSQIVIWESSDVLQVPTSALFRVSDEWQVFVVREDRAKQIPVQIGQSNGLQTQVLNGLAQGDLVIVHPSDQINDGRLVQNRDIRTNP